MAFWERLPVQRRAVSSVTRSPSRSNVVAGVRVALLTHAPCPARVRQDNQDDIFGTDLHIPKGDVSGCQSGRILGHEGVGTMEIYIESSSYVR